MDQARTVCLRPPVKWQQLTNSWRQTRTEAQKLLGEPPPGRSALERRYGGCAAVLQRDHHGV
jgi:hypothetical protein